MFDYSRKWAYKKLVLSFIGLSVHRLWSAEFSGPEHKDSVERLYLDTVFDQMYFDLISNIWLIVACYKKMLLIFEICFTLIVLNVFTIVIIYFFWMRYMIFEKIIDVDDSLMVLAAVMFLSIPVLGVFANHLYMHWKIKKAIYALKYGIEV